VLESEEFPAEGSGTVQVNRPAMLLGLHDSDTQDNGILILVFFNCC